MIKQSWVAECDLCGKTECAKMVSGRYNDPSYEVPSGWGYGHNRQFILCPECLLLRGGDSGVESNGEERERS